MFAHFDPKLKTIVENDLFDYVSIDVFSQREKNDIIRSIAFFSRGLFSTECNYEIYDKELLVIVKCFEK